NVTIVGVRIFGKDREAFVTEAGAQKRLRTGDQVAGYTVKAIDSGGVTLTSPSGDVVSMPLVVDSKGGTPPKPAIPVRPGMPRPPLRQRRRGKRVGHPRRADVQGRTIWRTIAVVAAFGLAAAGPARAQVEETAPPPAAPSGDQPLGEEEAMVLNFERADIREVIHSLATALGISYTIDPRIEGQVTIRTNGKIAREDLFPLFNQI